MKDCMVEFCPLTKQNCYKTDCAWFGKWGQCCILTLEEMPERLEEMVTVIEALEQTIKNKDFQM